MSVEPMQLDFVALDALAAMCPVGQPDGIVVLLHDKAGAVIGAKRANVWKQVQRKANKQGKLGPPAIKMEVGGWTGEPCVATEAGRIVGVKASAYVAKTVAAGMATSGRAINGPDDFGDE